MGQAVTRVTLEIAVGTPDEAVAAERAGADRLELSSGLDVGGLTPSLGLFRAVREAVRLPVWVLIRPRSGGFTYSERELGVMQTDAEQFLSEGADGIVIGALSRVGTIDREGCRSLVESAKGRATFHRAFDFLPDPLAALDALISLGFARVLTSGGATTATSGAERLAALVRHSAYRIEILPAGSIRPENVANLVRLSRCDQIHAAVRTDVTDPIFDMHPPLTAGMGRTAEMSESLVRSLRLQLDRLTTSV